MTRNLSRYTQTEAPQSAPNGGEKVIRSNYAFPLWKKSVLQQTNQQHGKSSSKSLVRYLLIKRKAGHHIHRQRTSSVLRQYRWALLLGSGEQTDFRAQRCGKSEVSSGTQVVKLIRGYRSCSYCWEFISIVYRIFIIFLNIESDFGSFFIKLLNLNTSALN